MSRAELIIMLVILAFGTICILLLAVNGLLSLK